MPQVTGTPTNFQSEVIDHKGKVLVDFWAPWCGPCQMLSPLLDEIATEFGQLVKVVKVNVDEHPSLSSQFGISSIPAVLVVNNGTVINTIVGFHQKQDYLTALK